MMDRLTNESFQRYMEDKYRHEFEVRIDEMEFRIREEFYDIYDAHLNDTIKPFEFKDVKVNPSDIIKQYGSHCYYFGMKDYAKKLMIEGIMPLELIGGGSYIGPRRVAV